MNILLAGQNYRITGGSDRVFFDEMKLLQDNGHTVIPYCASHPDNLESPWAKYFPAAPSFENPSIADALNYIYSPAARRGIEHLVREVKPDIAHLHIYYGKLTSSIIGALKKHDIPIVQTLHEYKLVCPVYTLTSQGAPCEKCSDFKFFNAAINRCNRGSLIRSALSTIESYTSLALGAVEKINHFVAVSDFLKKQVVRMGVPEHKVTTIYNFTEASNYTPSYTHDNYFLFFGRLEKNKGVDYLISAFSLMPDINLVMVGTGSEEESLRKTIEDKKLNNIRLVGFQSGQRLTNFIQRSKCVMVPSTWNETFGLTITEAFAYGKPVIASRVGGIPEVVSDGEDALLIEPGSVEEIISAVRKISESKSTSADMGRCARKNVEAKFNKELHYDKLHELYRKFI